MPTLPSNVVIGKYRIEKCVGAGGMGEVYRATNVQTKSPVAVKVLTTTGESETALARFRNEAVIQYNLRHPNVAELYEYIEYQGKPCIVMEFVEGRTLDEWIRESGPIEPVRALEILSEICDAVSYMHSKGTIHRDIKSENIRIDSQGKAKLLDFGIAVSRRTPAFTRVGYSIGTPEKMAPEQHQGLRGDARSDVWALGVLLYEMVTGAVPFANTNPNGLREDIISLRFIPAQKRRPGLPKPVLRIISNCLRLKPDERYASAGVLLREAQLVRRRLEGERWKRISLTNPAILAAALALLVLILLYNVLRAPDTTNTGSEATSEAPQEVTPAPRPAGQVRNPGASSSRGGGYTAPSGTVPAAGGGTDPGSPNTPQVSPYSFTPPVDNPSVGGNPVSIPAPPQPVAPPPDNIFSPDGEQRTVRVATSDGPAEVAGKDGRVLGSTPYAVTGPVGSMHEFWLRRQGYQPLRVEVQITNNKNAFTYVLEKDDTVKKD